MPSRPTRAVSIFRCSWRTREVQGTPTGTATHSTGLSPAGIPGSPRTRCRARRPRGTCASSTTSSWSFRGSRSGRGTSTTTSRFNRSGSTCTSHSSLPPKPTMLPSRTSIEAWATDPDSVPRAALVGLWHRRIPRGHQVELEGLDSGTRPEDVADDPHVLVASESVVIALRKTSQIDGDGRRAVGRRQRHRLAAEIDPQDAAVDDQRQLLYGRRLGCRFRREDRQEQANHDSAPPAGPIPVAHSPAAGGL